MIFLRPRTIRRGGLWPAMIPRTPVAGPGQSRGQPRPDALRCTHREGVPRTEADRPGAIINLAGVAMALTTMKIDPPCVALGVVVWIALTWPGGVRAGDDGKDWSTYNHD